VVLLNSELLLLGCSLEQAPAHKLKQWVEKKKTALLNGLKLD